MPGSGKFTVYVPANSPKRTFMEKLYNQSPFIGVSQEDSPTYFSNMGNKFLIPMLQQGDPALFPNGVRLDFSGAPDLPADVQWANPGDPANAYVPDIVSPGPGPGGAINVSPNDDNPDIAIEDVKPGYIPGKVGTDADGGTGTASPNVTSEDVYKLLGTTYMPGSSK